MRSGGEVEGENVTLYPDQYTAVVNWAKNASKVPGRCRALLREQRRNHASDLWATRARCVSDVQLGIAEGAAKASKRLGLDPWAAALIAGGTFVIGALVGALVVITWPGG